MAETIAVIIPTPDKHRPRTKACIEAVKATTKDVIVEVVESSGPDFRFSRSINQGIQAHPDAAAWIILNDDCIVQPGWLEAMLTQAGPGVGLVGANLHYPDGRVQHRGGYIAGPLGYLWHCGVLARAPFFAVHKLLRTPRTHSPYCYHHKVPGHRLDFLTGALLLITRQAWETVGAWDEDYIFSFEDVDYSLRVKEAGLRLTIPPTGCQGVHEERASGQGMNQAILSSEATFNNKWPVDRIRRTRGPTNP